MAKCNNGDLLTAQRTCTISTTDKQLHIETPESAEDFRSGRDGLPLYRTAVPVRVMTSGVSVIQAAGLVSRRAPRVRRYSSGSNAVPSTDTNSKMLPLSLSRHNSPEPTIHKDGREEPQSSSETQSRRPSSQNVRLLSRSQLDTVNELTLPSGQLPISTGSLNVGSSLSRHSDDSSLSKRILPLQDSARAGIVSGLSSSASRSNFAPADNLMPMKFYDPERTFPFQQKDYKKSKGKADITKQLSADSDSKLSAFRPLSTVLSRFFQHGIVSHADAQYSVGLPTLWLVERNPNLKHLHLQLIDAVLYSEHVPMLDVDVRSWACHLLAGGLAGAVSRTCTAPLDRLKVMRMVGGSRTGGVSMVSMFEMMIKEGGVRSLWRGNAMNVVKVVPETALKFAIYEQIKRWMHGRQADRTHELCVYERFLAGSLAGFVSQTAIYPCEVLKTRMVLRRTGQYTGVLDCVQRLLGENGVKSFYRGYLPNVLGIIPYAGIDLAVYETLKRRYVHRSADASEPSTVVMLACGLVSSSCGQLASYPLSLIRTRLQANNASDAGRASMLGQCRYIYQTDGLVGFYRGLGANFLKVAPAVCLSYAVYENVRSMLGVSMT